MDFVYGAFVGGGGEADAFRRGSGDQSPVRSLNEISLAMTENRSQQLAIRPIRDQVAAYRHRCRKTPPQTGTPRSRRDQNSITAILAMFSAHASAIIQYFDDRFMLTNRNPGAQACHAQGGGNIAGRYQLVVRKKPRGEASFIMVRFRMNTNGQLRDRATLQSFGFCFI